ncbi:hypothetical protein ACIA8O_18985 [Kitasatospora sp. NPDC051853]|uniref:hypothetical protein n=1 Tax=Kitasatospora sp. NPDC051853 TaxID=3364058 RepID=UPI0037AAA1EC
MPDSKYAVEVLHCSGTGEAARWTVSSGYCVGGRHVLTVGHAVGPGEVVVRFWGGAEYPAEIVAHGGEHTDLALLILTGADAPEAPQVRSRGVDTSRATSLACQGLGYPWWKEGDKPRGPGSRPRGRAQLVGYVPTAEGQVGGRLTFHLKAAPRDARNESVWPGISGTLVFATDGRGGEFAIGVVTEHRLREGVSALTVEPLATVERLAPPERKLFRAALGGPEDGPPPLLSGTAYPGPARPSRLVVAGRVLLASVLSSALVAGALWWNARGPTESGPALRTVLSGVGTPGDLQRWWVLKDPLPKPAPDTTIGELAAVHEGAPMVEDTVRFTLEGNRHRTVMVTDIGARVLDRTRPYDGAAYGTESAGGVDALVVGLDLDEAQPRARAYDQDKRTLGAPHFDRNGFGLTFQEVAPVTVSVFAQRDLIHYVLVVSYTVDGRAGKTEITGEGGRPFVLSGLPDRVGGAYVSPPDVSAKGWKTVGSNRSDFGALAVGLRP